MEFPYSSSILRHHGRTHFGVVVDEPTVSGIEPSSYRRCTLDDLYVGPAQDYRQETSSRYASGRDADNHGNLGRGPAFPRVGGRLSSFVVCVCWLGRDQKCFLFVLESSGISSHP